jgi:hypothetical protein
LIIYYSQFRDIIFNNTKKAHTKEGATGWMTL